MIRILGAAALIGLACLPATGRELRPLTPPEAVDFIKGGDFDVHTSKWSARFTFRQDGVVLASGQRGKDSGSYRLDGNRLCIRWQREKRDACGDLVRGEDGRVLQVLPGGQAWMVFGELR